MLFILRNETVRQNCLKHLKLLHANGDREVLIREHKTKRSLNQNAYYWAIVDILADYTGQNKEDMHRELAIRLLGAEEFVVDGKTYHGPISTTKLSTKEFTNYLEKVMVLAMSLGLAIPSRSYFGMEE